ncbi:MAG: hypothetical protein ACREH8_11905 [Opitutaceae bacterium]
MLAILFLAIAVVLTVIPGPAFVFFILAGALLATESRTIGRFMDWCEVIVRKLVRWAKLRGSRLPTGARIALIIVAAAGSAAFAYFGYRFLRS